MQATSGLEDPQDHALVHTLAYAGLIPFALLSVLIWLVGAELQTWVAIALSGYAALIASFLGGIHWGIGWNALREAGVMPLPHARRSHFLWGVAPSLLAWPGLLMPAHAGLAWLGLVLIICYLVDRVLYKQAGLHDWLTLRFRLSAAAALSCFIAAGAL